MSLIGAIDDRDKAETQGVSVQKQHENGIKKRKRISQSLFKMSYSS